MTKEKKQEFTLRISKANKTQLIVILYEMTICYVQDAKEAYAKEDREEFHQAIVRAKNTLKELMTSLDFEYELAGGLFQLYIYINKELSSADICNTDKTLDTVIIVLSGLHEAYMTISKFDTSDGIMSNTQNIYAGLTYDKNHMAEVLPDEGSNRGFFA